MRFVGAGILLLLSVLPALASEECQLKQVASLEMSELPEGRIGVPASIEGHAGRMVLDIGHRFSSLTQGAKSEFGLTPQDTGKDFLYLGKQVTQSVTAARFSLGNVTAQKVSFFLLPSGPSNVENTASPISDDLRRAAGKSVDDFLGVLGTNILDQYDIELDFNAHRLNLFEHAPCKGSPVYWADTAAALPFLEDAAGALTVAMQLDGRPVRVSLSSMGTHAIMGLSDATDKRGMDIKSAAFQPIAWHGADVSAYEHTFQALTGDGISISQPQIILLANLQHHPDDWRFHARIGDVVPTDKPLQGFPSNTVLGRSDIELGLEQLRKLRLYIDFKDHTIYATGATATKNPRATAAVESSVTPTAASSPSPSDTSLTPSSAPNDRIHNCDAWLPGGAFNKPGITVLKVRFDATGQVHEPSVVTSSGQKSLDEAALKCAAQIVIPHVSPDGKPVEIIWRLGVSWRTEGHSYFFTPSKGGAFNGCSHIYPASAVRAHEEGRTMVSFSVGSDGTVQSPTLIESSGWPELDAATISCVQTFDFSPITTPGGDPATVQEKFAINWRMRR